VQGDLLDLDAVSLAMKGVSRAYFCYPIQLPGILSATAYFIQSALEEGVSGIVNMSQISSRRAAKSHAAQDHWIAERMLDNSGIPVVHIRPTFFAEWLTYFDDVKKSSRIILPFGDGRWAPIAGEDQARVIAELLINPSEHERKIYPLFGPKEYNLSEIADLLSDVLKRKITYVPISIEDFRTEAAKMNLTPHFIQHISNVAQDCRDGLFSGTNDIVEKITGHKPLSTLDFIIKNKAVFE
jgi:NAD(P)H dehydrogenase (quinone)